MLRYIHGANDARQLIEADEVIGRLRPMRCEDCGRILGWWVSSADPRIAGFPIIIHPTRYVDAGDTMRRLCSALLTCRRPLVGVAR